MFSSERTIAADVLILGSGLAGLLLALKLARCEDIRLIVASKDVLTESNSTYAQGGLAAVTAANAFDSPDEHLVDTLKSGAGLTDVQAARSIIFGGARLIEELGEFGVRFDRGANGAFELALEGGHSQARVLHNKDATGKAITAALAERLKEIAARTKRVTILEGAYASELLVEDGSCLGARLEMGSVRLSAVVSYTVLATGGIGQIYRRTTNPGVATGDGIAMAYNAGARLIDMEFVQFHPTALCKEGAPPFLISEAVRGAGATLLDQNGKRFTKRFHQDGELATRDVVARAIHTVMRENGLASVGLDMRPIGSRQIAAKFPTILRRCSEYGIDILNEPIPIAPAAHYFMGGIESDIEGGTSLPGLYAIGECASTGLHGANRLASNSLLEAGVTALRTADALLASHRLCGPASQHCSGFEEPSPRLILGDVMQFRSAMYSNAGLVRSQAGLSVLLSEIAQRSRLAGPGEDCSSSSMLTVGRLIAEAALLREETRGGHYREDYPSTDNINFAKRLWLSKSGFGWVAMPQTAQNAHRQAALSA